LIFFQLISNFSEESYPLYILDVLVKILAVEN